MFVYDIVLIGFAVSPALSSVVRSLATISTCRGNEFTCLDGTCTSAGTVCDIYWDCPDGSDEASCYSSTNSNLTEVFHKRYKRQSPCGLYQWRCTDGTCIAVGGKCDGKTDCPDKSDETDALCRIIKRSTVSGKCVLPPYPEHGTYVAVYTPDATPGQSFEYAQLNITCEQGYGVVGDAVPYCLDGTWLIPIQKCVPFCRLDPDVSVHYKCLDPETDSYRICNQFEPSGTLVKPECNTPVYGSKHLLVSMSCRSDGQWNRIIKCKPECGRVTPYAEGLIWGGEAAMRGELPWHVAIYKKPIQRKNYYEQICGGSLVSNKIVISAAHCFWDNGKEEKQPASKYAVATAKLFREWDHKDDKDAQKSELKSIELTPYYRGVRTNFQHDIAILILETPFVYYTNVRPVCLDLFDTKFNDLQLQIGNFGKVAGWGLTEENGPASPVLKVVQLPFVPIRECIRITPESFTESITGDKICAGYNNGTGAVCKGDSGGGLSFPETERGTTRYYLRGVVSTAPRVSQTCNVFTVTTFTEIYKHKDFINQFMSTTCTLPPYPEYGFYEVVGDPAAKPGDDAETAYLNVSCNHGYKVIGHNVVQCILGEWSTRMPKCVRDFTSNRPQFAPTPAPTSAPTQAPQTAAPSPPPEDFVDALPEPPVCGQSNATFSRVLGGAPAKLGDFPWMALLGYKTKRTITPRWRCGGSLVSPRHVLTAAHCIHNREDLYVVRLGELDLAREEEGATPVDVLIKQKHKHEQYNATNFTNDIGILLLDHDVTFTDQIRPICIPKDGILRANTFEDYNPMTAGWGQLNTPGATHLQFVQVSIVSNENCTQAYSAYKAQNIDDRVLCAGFKNGGKEACQGDSGGPLMQPIWSEDTLKTFFYQIGVVSYGKKCSGANFPLVISRVTHFVPWIEEKVLGSKTEIP